MIGWRRVATFIGEKIGKEGATYAQGMSATVMAAVSIGLAKLPCRDAGFPAAYSLFCRGDDGGRWRRLIA